MNKLNIILDVDDVVLDWHRAFAKKFKFGVINDWIPYNVIKPYLDKLTKDRLFWWTLPLKHYPNFTPFAYVSARGVPVSWTKQAMKLKNLPGRSKVYHVPWGHSKIEVLKSLNVDIFIDDKYETFLECHKNGIFCLLMDTGQNKHHRTKLRLNSLDISEITKLWQKYS